MAVAYLVGVTDMKNGSQLNNVDRGERLQIMLSPEELKALDDFRFKHRMPSRAAAVRELFRLGLAGAGMVVENEGIRSGEYGVLRQPKSLEKRP